MSEKLVDLYLRLSVDREGKDSLERQEKDLRRWAKREGLTVRTVWADKVSGYKRGVVREAFDNAVAAVGSGEVGTLAVWKLDRLSRRGAGQVGLVLDSVEAVGGRVYFLKDSLDSSDSSHRTLIILVSEQARAESANTSLRVRDKIAQDAAKGIPKKGTRPFGWKKDGITLRPAEADLIREAVADLLAERRSMLKIAADWTEAGALTDGMRRKRKGRDGIKRPALPRWTATTVRQVLLRERNAGHLVHQGIVMPESTIAPIISPEDHEALKARIKLGTPVGARAQSLLGGILTCECGAPMHSTASYSQRKGGPRHEYTIYKCAQTLYDKSRKHASINVRIADDLFVAFIFRDLYMGELDSPADADSPAAALKKVTEKMTTNAENIAFVGRQLLDKDLTVIHPQARASLKVYEAERSALTAERDALLARTAEGGALRAFIEEWQAKTTLGHETAEDQAAWEARFWEAWRSVGLERQRAMIRSRYRPSVRVGGRGVGRIIPNPINPVTFGQPLPDWDAVSD